MESNIRKPKGLLELFLHLPEETKKAIKILLIISGLIFLTQIGFSQTTGLSFTQIPITDPDFNRPFAGAEQWNTQNTVNIPQANVSTPRMDAYYRFGYTDICPYNGAADTYDWSIFDRQINDAIAKNQKFSFAVMPLCNLCSQGGYVNNAHLYYPLYLHYQMQSESVKDFSSGGEWIPNWNSANWLNAWKKMYQAINTHLMNGSFNGVAYKNVINYVDISGYGEYGEWTNNNFSGPAGSQATTATLDSIISYTVRGLQNFQIVALDPTFDGGLLANTNIPVAVGYYALTIKNNAGLLGWRRENWGWTDWFNSAWLENNKNVYNGVRFDTAISNRYKYAPVVGEPADLGQAYSNGQSFGDLPRQIQFYHVASFGNGNLDQTVNDYNTQNNFRLASKYAGFRLVLSGGSMTTTLNSGSAFNISINWQNIGAAPTYENWNVVYELRNSGGAVVWTSNSYFNPRLFAPSGTATAVSDNFTLPSTVANGTYNLYMIVRDPVNYRKPLPLGITGRNSDGSYLVRGNITVNKGAANISPIAKAGADQVIQLPGSSVSLAGTGTDQDGSISSYAWTLLSGPAGSGFTAPASAGTSVNGLVSGVYQFVLTVTDNQGATGKDTVQVTVNGAAAPPANKNPVAKAGADISITLPTSSATLNGTSSSDPDGTVAGFVWTKISGPSQFLIANNSISSTAVSSLTTGVYSFQLKVTDNAGATGLDTVKVIVNAAAVNQPPQANAGANLSITLPSNTTNLVGSGSTDADGTISTYAWTQVSGPATASISSQSNSNTAITGLVQGNYVFQLKVTDNGGLSDLDSMIVTVNAAPAAPAANKVPIADAGISANLNMPVSTYSLDGSKSYDPDGTINAYSWTLITGPNVPVITGANSAKPGLTSLIAGRYTYQLTVTDNGGASSSAQVKIIIAAAANTAPVANAGATQSITSPASIISLDGSGSYDPDGTIKTYNWVTVSGPGSITISNSNTVKPTASGLQPGVYVFELTITDDKGAVAKDQVSIVVYPKPVIPNQAPVANAGNGVTLSLPQNSTALNGSSSFDPDGTISSYSWTQISGPGNALITGSNTGTPTVSKLVAGSYTFQLTVTDNNSATNSDEVVIVVNAAAVKVNLPPSADAGPSDTLLLPQTTFTLNASRSSDPDGNIMAYQWKQVSGPNTPVASAMSMPQVSLSDLVKGEYQFEVTVTDNDGAKATSNMKLMVDDGGGINFSDRMSVFPNPAHSVINSRVTSSVTGTVRVYVYDMNGKKVMETQAEKTGDVYFQTFDISQLAGGMYTLQIVIGNRKTMVSKFIKN